MTGNEPCSDGVTLRDLDAAAGAPKGAAFRAFKRLAPQLREGSDYVILHHARDHAQIAALRARARIYAGSVNVVVLGGAAAQAVAAAMRSDAAKGR